MGGRADGRAHADAAAQKLLVKQERGGHGRLCAFGDAQDITRLAASFKQNGELIPAKASEQDVPGGEANRAATTSASRKQDCKRRAISIRN
jgi:hypothetical protein